MIEILIFSFFAGVLTVLAPCILPIIPVILGGSLATTKSQKTPDTKRPYVIIASLVVSIFIFSLLLKGTTLLLGIPAATWSILSGAIIALIGINVLFPQIWEAIALKTNLSLRANKNLGTSQQSHGLKRDILLGAALGPVFNSCSPTYALIVAVLLPTSLLSGIFYLLAYSIGLGSVLLLIALFGQSLTRKIRWLSNPKGIFQKILGVALVIIGLVLVFSLDKTIQSAILDSGIYSPIEQFEKSFHIR